MLVDGIADVGAALMFFQTQNLTIDEVREVAIRMHEKYERFKQWQANPSKP